MTVLTRSVDVIVIEVVGALVGRRGCEQEGKCPTEHVNRVHGSILMDVVIG